MKKCETCKWHDDYSWACCNGESDECADFTDNDYCCEHWESDLPDGKAAEYEKETDRVLKILVRVKNTEPENYLVSESGKTSSISANWTAHTFSFISGCCLALSAFSFGNKNYLHGTLLVICFLAFFIETILLEFADKDKI